MSGVAGQSRDLSLAGARAGQQELVAEVGGILGAVANGLWRQHFEPRELWVHLAFLIQVIESVARSQCRAVGQHERADRGTRFQTDEEGARKQRIPCGKQGVVSLWKSGRGTQVNAVADAQS